MSSGVKGADTLSIEVRDSVRVDTPGNLDLDAFDSLSLGAAPSRWLAGKTDVEKALGFHWVEAEAVDGSGPVSVRESFGGLSAALQPVQGQHVIEFSEPARNLASQVHGRAGVRAADWWATAEGKSFRLEVSPGTIGLASIDTNKAEKSVSRAVEAQYSLVDQAAAFINDAVTPAAGYDAFGKALVDYETGELYDEPRTAKVRSEVTHWSKRSRMRMVRAVAQLDYSDWSETDGVLAMVTLTYPAQWEKVVPNGKTMKKHFERLRMRWVKAIGRWRVLWKLEFQRRGAPHIHFLARVPAMVKGVPFERWLSKSWADVVGASKWIDGLDRYGNESSEYVRHLAAGTGVDFSGSKFSDPRRIALYFLGHSMKGPDGKEYQHIVPELWQSPGNGPGRFWGFSGFERAVVEVELSLDDFYRFARELRKLKRSRDWKAQLIRQRGMVKRARLSGGAVPSVSALDVRVTQRKTRAMGGGGSVLGGWVLLNDALPVVAQYAELLRGCAPSSSAPARFDSGFRVAL